MRPPARLQAAIDLADLVLASAREGGAAADTLVRRYFAGRRYAGSRDRRAVRELLFEAIRFTANRPLSGRTLFAGFARTARPDLLPLFDGSPHAPAPLQPSEEGSAPSLVPDWLLPPFKARFGADWEAEARALVGRAPLDIRVSQGISPDAVARALPVASCPVEGLSQGLRLAAPAPLEALAAFREGWFEIQDAGSQFVTHVAAARPGETVVDLCAGAGGKTLALADSMQGEGILVASDTSRRRLMAMEERRARHPGAAFVKPRLLNPGREAEALQDLAGKVDLVLVDAPCSGTGTWRRNPELRWRLTPARLQQLLGLQARLMALGASLLKPGGRLLYAVCSVLPAEGREQAEKAARHLPLTIMDIFMLSPHVDGCDGFQVAKLRKDCSRAENSR